MTTTEFSSEGFDLDAASSDVIYEIGGGVSSTTEPETPPVLESKTTETTAESYKQQGNQAFLKGEYLEAYEWYTQAIEATPGMKADELLQQKEEWEKEQHRLARERLYERDQKQQQKSKNGTNQEEQEEPLPNDDDTQKETQFTAPPHEHATELSIYYANRAAALYSLQRYEEVVRDCNVALLWNPVYVKALIRRSKGHEQLEHFDLALADAKQALELGDAKTKQSLRPTVARLQKVEDERLEKLKTETLGQLKELGNSILGNFGLSLDNFQAVQDPSTGSYSISFQNNK